MNLPKRNSADGRCYWMKPEVQEELQPLFDQCIQDAIDGRITRLDSLWPPVVVSSEGAPFDVHDLVRKGNGPKHSGPRPLTRKRPLPSAKTCAAKAGGVKLTTIYVVCWNRSCRRSILS